MVVWTFRRDALACLGVRCWSVLPARSLGLSCLACLARVGHFGLGTVRALAAWSSCLGLFRELRCGARCCAALRCLDCRAASFGLASPRWQILARCGLFRFAWRALACFGSPWFVRACVGLRRPMLACFACLGLIFTNTRRKTLEPHQTKQTLIVRELLQGTTCSASGSSSSSLCSACCLQRSTVGQHKTHPRREGCEALTKSKNRKMLFLKRL